MSVSHKRIAIVVDNRITGLPRNLIHSILERMPVKDAARTSILSRKWRYIWSSLPNLVFDEHFFEENSSDKPFGAQEFVKIISKILLLHIGPIVKCTIYIPYINFEFDCKLHITEWLLFLTRNGIKELCLENHTLQLTRLPSYVFSYPGLTHLNLNGFKLPNSFFGFRNLIRLDFKNVVFDRIIRNLTTNHAPTPTTVPLLKILTFEGCIGVYHLNIHAPKLKIFYAIDSGNVNSTIFNSTPNLSMLYIAPGKSVENFSQLLAAVPVPKRISIMFNHLNDLVLDGLRFDDLDQVSCVLCLLRSSPNLRELYITVSAGGANGMESDLSYLEAPGCMDLMLNQLQTVNITSINGLRSELLFIKCVLASSPLLEKVIVQYDETVVDAKEGFRISTELMRFGRASPKAELVYVKP
ncbi:hypothetical protein TEA_023650 [Camellia sinensis var. sinensis]|uniref:F-box domain-containing protein n=1 Tax=Camellia sinensis var. sinensis TaxID=542762 RepID=A0A4S4CZ87_CAMSN|nr:hypothetical protein TEA_023650 [Camellia sinensis var. sinensis]